MGSSSRSCPAGSHNPGTETAPAGRQLEVRPAGAQQHGAKGRPMSSGPSTEWPQQLADRRDALSRPCPTHGTLPDLLCLTTPGAGICPDRWRQPRPPAADNADLWAFYLAGWMERGDADLAVVRAVEAAGGSLEQAGQHIADLGPLRLAHEPGG